MLLYNAKLWVMLNYFSFNLFSLISLNFTSWNFYILPFNSSEFYHLELLTVTIWNLNFTVWNSWFPSQCAQIFRYVLRVTSLLTPKLCGFSSHNVCNVLKIWNISWEEFFVCVSLTFIFAVFKREIFGCSICENDFQFF